MWHLGYSECAQEEGPGARHSHSAVVHDQAMWVFGGMCDLQPRNDFWKWSFGKNLDPTGHAHGRPPQPQDSIYSYFCTGRECKSKSVSGNVNEPEHRQRNSNEAKF